MTWLAYDWFTAYSNQWTPENFAEGFLWEATSVQFEANSSSAYANLTSHWSMSPLPTWWYPCCCSGKGSLLPDSKLLWSKTCFRTFPIENPQPPHSAAWLDCRFWWLECSWPMPMASSPSYAPTRMVEIGSRHLTWDGSSGHSRLSLSSCYSSFGWCSSWLHWRFLVACLSPHMFLLHYLIQ